MIETRIYEDVPNKPGYVRAVGLRKAHEVFQELETTLKEAALLPDEYFSLSYHFKDKDIPFPDWQDIYCYASWGNSEGIYLDVCIVTEEGNRICFATGKTLAEDSASFDRMQYIAGYIYKLFQGDRQTSPRYRMTPAKAVPSMDHLLRRVEAEYLEYLRTHLLHKQESVWDHGMDIGLRSMVLSALPQCQLSDEKIQELMASENALDMLTELCSCIDKAIEYDVKDMIASCATITGELEHMRELTNAP